MSAEAKAGLTGGDARGCRHSERSFERTQEEVVARGKTGASSVVASAHRRESDNAARSSTVPSANVCFGQSWPPEPRSSVICSSTCDRLVTSPARRPASRAWIARSGAIARVPQCRSATSFWRRPSARRRELGSGPIDRTLRSRGFRPPRRDELAAARRDHVLPISISPAPTRTSRRKERGEPTSAGWSCSPRPSVALVAEALDATGLAPIDPVAHTPEEHRDFGPFAPS